jgi:Carbohydrate-selective porin, OprB family
MNKKPLSKALSNLAFCISFLISQTAFSQTEIKYLNEFSYSGEVLVHTTPFGVAHLATLGWLQNISHFTYGERHSFHIGLSFTHDNEPSATKTGDLQTFSNLEAGLKYGFGEIFYEYRAPKFNIQFGQQDINSEFLATENGGLFSSSSFGIDPVMTINVDMPTFPFTAMSLTSEIMLGKKTVLRAGLYNGSFPMKDHYLAKSWSFDRDKGIIFIIEPEFHLFKDKVVTKFGAYHHSGLFQEIESTNMIRGLWGIYSVTDFRLYQKEGKSFNFFYQFNTSTRNISDVDFYFGTGFRAINLIGINKENELGLAVAHASINAQYQEVVDEYNVESESLIELNWLIKFSDHIALQPYTQLIIRKDTGNETHTPFVFSIRANFIF